MGDEAGGGAVKPKVIMVADDDREICTTISEALCLRGMAAICVHHGNEVIAALRRHRPDLIILDILLPGRDGYDICREMKSDAELSAIPVVMFTQKDQQHDRLTGLQVGAVDFIPKPFYIDSLLNKIEYILTRQP